MRPTEVRSRVLADHSALRLRLSSLADLSRDALEGAGARREDLRAAALNLLESLAEHMYWEDRYLAPALRRADAWGEERASQLAEDHREQRALLEYLVRGLEDRERPSLLLARNLGDLVQLLLDDMDSEEASLLDPRVLRNDVVGIDVETG
jgi:iron-sulfur cluster repair protein YtfE (RIC family)